jgi:hypothetical protein
MKLQPSTQPSVYFGEDAKLRAGDSFNGGTLATWPGESEFDYCDCHCPHGGPGDQLWVKETFGTLTAWDNIPSRNLPISLDASQPSCDIFYQADGNPWVKRWRPSIHLPRLASRIRIEITNVRVERLQEISEEDAKAEGVDAAFWHPPPSAGFMQLWESINAKRGFGWEENPWVWVIEFRRIKP